MIFSIVIPIVPKHDRFLQNVFQSLQFESNLIKEIIIARSELPDYKVPKYRKFLESIALSYGADFLEKIKLSPVAQVNLAFANLNRGWNMAQGEYVVFCGADDIYHPFRLRMISEVIKTKPKANLILHSHYREELNPKYLKHDSISFDHNMSESELKLIVKHKLIETTEIRQATFLDGKRNLLLESFGDTSIKIPLNIFNIYDVTQGHAVVRTSLRSEIIYRPLAYGEDGVLCRDILEYFGEVYFLAQKLSVYRKYQSVNRIASRKSRLKHKILKIVPEIIRKLIFK